MSQLLEFHAMTLGGIKIRIIRMDQPPALYDDVVWEGTVDQHMSEVKLSITVN